MKLSEIIRRFQDEMKQNGDAEVYTSTGFHKMAPANVRVVYVPNRLPLCYDIEVELEGSETDITIT